MLNARQQMRDDSDNRPAKGAQSIRKPLDLLRSRPQVRILLGALGARRGCERASFRSSVSRSSAGAQLGPSSKLFIVPRHPAVLGSHRLRRRPSPRTRDTRLAMSQENVEIIRRSMEHFKRTGEWLWDVIDPEIEIHDNDVPDGDVFRGHAGWLKWERTFDSAWERVSIEPEEYIDAGGDKVVLLLRLARSRQRRHLARAAGRRCLHPSRRQDSSNGLLRKPRRSPRSRGATGVGRGFDPARALNPARAVTRSERSGAPRP